MQEPARSHPLTHVTTLVQPSAADANAYAAALEGARAAACAARGVALGGGAYRTHVHAQLLRPLLSVCSGLVGEVGSRAARDADAGLSDPRLSSLASVVRTVVPSLPTHRDDFHTGAEHVPNEVHLRCISAVSPLYLRCISAVSPLIS